MNLNIPASMTEGLAERVCHLVEGLETPGFYKGLHIQIDLTNPQGRWELLVLAVLLAARVSESVAETAFEALQRHGLLDLERMRLMRSQDTHQVGEILHGEYRGIVDRGKKAAALFANAQMLHDIYDGDLNRLYELGRTSAEVVPMLQQFKQIHTRARWLCRSMHEAGLWTDLAKDEVVFLDSHVRRALSRLGLVDNNQAWPRLKQEMYKVITDLFDGDTTCLYRLGRYVCSVIEPETCNGQCPLRDICLYAQS
ncbi:MAG: hypothetical protein ACOYEP_01760 [Limnochordia bacterium]